MPTVYYSDNYKTEPMCEAPGAGIVVARTFIFTVTAALAVDDQILLMPLQGKNLPGFTLLGFSVDIPDLDSGSGLVLQLGDDDNLARFVAPGSGGSGSIGQVAGRFSSAVGVTTGSGTVAGGAVYGSLPVSYTANKNLILSVQTGPASGATSGVIRGSATFAQFGIRSV
jgi:hypothetical protein